MGLHLISIPLAFGCGRVNPGQNILTQETIIIQEISSTTVLKSYKKTKTLPCVSAHVPNNSNISFYVTYCYYCAKQRIIGSWNKSFSCLGDWHVWSNNKKRCLQTNIAKNSGSGLFLGMFDSSCYLFPLNIVVSTFFLLYSRVMFFVQ